MLAKLAPRAEHVAPVLQNGIVPNERLRLPWIVGSSSIHIVVSVPYGWTVGIPWCLSLLWILIFHRIRQSDSRRDAATPPCGDQSDAPLRKDSPINPSASVSTT